MIHTPPDSDAHPSVGDLLARLRAASGPDHTLDADIAEALGAEINRAHRRIGYACRNVPWHHYPSPRWECLPLYTYRLDAALALVERVLPTAVVGVENIGGLFSPCEARVITESDGGEVITQFEGEAPTAPLAVLIALLTALASTPPAGAQEGPQPKTEEE